eukprot:TRINITY_DN2136_c0_g1_i1.p1 TRINITY_DN2136_c0_g1~~TRINITY_DN2136_c0_g1_i1.p1  ORF type:complete len:111 (+),score=36.30 TRINITY_DN2136_c0_g1_i1:146-478(+)
MTTSAQPISIRRGDPKTAPRISDLSETPGGTLFATTPGGTRITYDRAALMRLANSPMSKTPPTGLTNIPGVTRGGEAHAGAQDQKSNLKSQKLSPKVEEEEGGDMFKMDQ